MPQLLIAVLAAGASRRLGRPKQLVEVDGEPLLRRQCRKALDARLGPVTAVLGCDAEVCAKTINDLPVKLLINQDWREGMASSVRTASHAAGEEGCEALLILLVDQFQVTSHDLQSMHASWLAAAPATACRSQHDDYQGPPVILARSLFPACQELSGDEGARRVLSNLDPELVHTYLMPNAGQDLDCLADLKLVAGSTRFTSS